MIDRVQINLGGIQELPNKLPCLGGGLRLQKPGVSLVVAQRVELCDRSVDGRYIIHSKRFVRPFSCASCVVASAPIVLALPRLCPFLTRSFARCGGNARAPGSDCVTRLFSYRLVSAIVHSYASLPSWCARCDRVRTFLCFRDVHIT